jgi:hypothetical protein
MSLRTGRSPNDETNLFESDSAVDDGSGGMSDSGSTGRSASSDASASGSNDASASGSNDASASSDTLGSGSSSADGSSQSAPDATLASGDDGGGDAASPGDANLASNCPPETEFPQTTFVNLAVAPGAPLVQGQGDRIPGDAGGAPPAGWDFHQGGLCRDGSPAGFYVHFSPAGSDRLFIYLEGGGTCSSATFCTHNPANLDMVFSGGAASQGQTILGSLTLVSSPQEPYVNDGGYSPGIFDFTNAANPFKDWNAVYVPYCTGDVHFGTADGVDVANQGVTAGPKGQHFVGALNLQSYIARIVPTFPNLTQVLLTGASAGGVGAGLNYGMVQDSFGKVPVVVIDDSGPPFSLAYLPACVQKEWRELWGFDKALPSDCAECFNSDGSGLTNITYYWLHKYPAARVGLVSTMEDEVLRLFYASGDNNCASNDATLLTIDQLTGGYTGAEYTQGLDDLLATFQCTARFATYYIGGMNPAYMHPTYHQHIFRNEFYQAITNDGGTTMAEWASDFVAGTIENVGP